MHKETSIEFLEHHSTSLASVRHNLNSRDSTRAKGHVWLVNVRHAQCIWKRQESGAFFKSQHDLHSKELGVVSRKMFRTNKHFYILPLSNALVSGTSNIISADILFHRTVGMSDHFFALVQAKSAKIRYRKLLSFFRVKLLCRIGSYEKNSQMFRKWSRKMCIYSRTKTVLV